MNITLRPLLLLVTLFSCQSYAASVAYSTGFLDTATFEINADTGGDFSSGVPVAKI